MRDRASSRTTASFPRGRWAVWCLMFGGVNLAPAGCAKSPPLPQGETDSSVDEQVDLVDAVSNDEASCDSLESEFCVSDCLADSPHLAVSLSCENGHRVCPSGYFRPDSCPADGCGVVVGSCCDTVTGVVTARRCDAGHRAECPTGTRQELPYRCIPDALNTAKCSALDGLACDGVAMFCHSFDLSETSCDCVKGDAGSAWHCSYYIGP